jgi:hypothetical protein
LCTLILAIIYVQQWHASTICLPRSLEKHPVIYPHVLVALLDKNPADEYWIHAIAKGAQRKYDREWVFPAKRFRQWWLESKAVDGRPLLRLNDSTWLRPYKVDRAHGFDEHQAIFKDIRFRRAQAKAVPRRYELATYPPPVSAERDSAKKS